MHYNKFANTEDTLSILGFGGVIVTNTPAKTAARYVSEAFDRGITYFDVAPFYGNAQQMLGPALRPYRERCFLACKTRERTAEGARRELEESLRLLNTDHFDLYQLHSLQKVEEDVNIACGPGGALETIVKARNEGKIRHIGFSAHTEEAAHAAMDRFDFDSVLFPCNYFSWTHGKFGPSVLERAREKNMARLGLKAIAHRPWTKEEFKSFFRPWHKCWYKPLEDPTLMETALRFALDQGLTAAIPPGHWDLFEMCLGIAERGELGPPSAEALEQLGAFAKEDSPLFRAA